jgi:hypothetical protein
MPRPHLTRLTYLTYLTLSSFSVAGAQVQSGTFALTTNEIERVGSFALAPAEWLYRPGYSITNNEKPQLDYDHTGFAPVAVPQFLNRILWWLDDSEDFKKHEDARLKKLGFDTDRAEDGWYHLTLVLPEAGLPLPKGEGRREGEGNVRTSTAPPLPANALPLNKRLYLEFEGVAMKCKAYCNGAAFGEHSGMFSRFSFDLTPHLKPGTNLFALYVSMEKIPASNLSMGEAVTVNLTVSKVRSLSKGMYGPLAPGFDNHGYDLHGIWQPVRLVIRGQATIEDIWFAPSLEGAEVRVQASSATRTRTAILKAKWTEANTTNIFAELDGEKIQLGKSATHTLWLSGAHPKLWTPANPNLYRLDVTLETPDGELLDSWSHNVGFRTFEIRGNQFFLNGHPYWLRGSNHLPYGKNPWDPELPRRLIKYLHDANVRITRTHATPWNEAWLDAADEIGLAVSLEGIRPWALAGKIGATPPELFQHWLMENEDVVKRARNHPSVFIYTIGNEMLLRDPKNLQKWQQLSKVVKQTRQLDPTRPIIASSDYQRDPDFYKTVLQPAGIDDGDIDDIHRYNNWYGASSFVTDSKFESEMKKRSRNRPFIGQEMSAGYPDLDTGLPVLRYTRDLLTPQAWVGQYAYPGSNPAIFLEHYRAVTKRWAEQLRFQRSTNTAGFMLFAAECWFKHSYDSASVEPYPVLGSVRNAWAPIGLALETGRRRFYGGEEFETAVYISNDDDKFRDYKNLELKLRSRRGNEADRSREAGDGTEADRSDFDRISLSQKTSFGLPLPKGEGRGEGEETARQPLSLVQIPALPYYRILKIPVRFKIPGPGAGRERSLFELSISENGAQISATCETIEIFSKSTTQFSPGPITVIHPKQPLADLAQGAPLRRQIEDGATVIVLSPSDEILKLFPDEILDSKPGEAEFADWSPIAGTKLAENLQPMDLKWWARTNDSRLFIASQSHRLKENGHARELLRYIPPHSYISADKLPEQYRTVLFEIPLGKGRLWICDLDLFECLSLDPAARLFADNLFRAAADPSSTANLPKLLSHEELLARPAHSNP